MNPLHVRNKILRFAAMIGVGGVGSGSFFLLNGNHTLGREESRSGRFMDRKDYCKLHIVSHYVKALLGPDFDAIPAGKVGDDDVGRRLYHEMEDAGLNLRYLELSKDDQTLFSFCFIYPDGSGGNLTTDDSGSSWVTPCFVDRAESEFARYSGRGIALAVPEVPLPARRRLLELGTAHSFFRVASFSSGEMKEVRKLQLLETVDLLSVNIDEASKAAGIAEEDLSLEAVVRKSAEELSKINPFLNIAITAGSRGSWIWNKKELFHREAIAVDAVSTAGAGDAFLAGIIAGLAAGLELPGAHELGCLVSALSVTSPHTIHMGIDRVSLAEFSTAKSIDLCHEVKGLLW
jgi:sugar/nucleoside kinase (ribokinase family)